LVADDHVMLLPRLTRKAVPIAQRLCPMNGYVRLSRQQHQHDRRQPTDYGYISNMRARRMFIADGGTYATGTAIHQVKISKDRLQGREPRSSTWRAWAVLLHRKRRLRHPTLTGCIRPFIVRGDALSSSVVLTQFRTENRFALFLELH